MTQDAASSPPEPTWEECMELIARLPAMTLEGKKEAIGTMIRNPSLGIRQRALSVGAVLMPDEFLVACLREEGDDVLRNAGLEMIKLRGTQAYGLAVRLLGDEDPDVVLQAVAVLDHLRDPRAFEPLRAILRHPDPNLLHHALVAIGRLGDERAVGDILPFLHADPWLQMAAVTALGDLRFGSAVRHLRPLLLDPFLGPMASEAIARIGGVRAFRVLAAFWMVQADTPEGDGLLELVHHTLGGLPSIPTEPPGLRRALAHRLERWDDPMRILAAQCLLGLGPGPEDDAALEILGRISAASSKMPASLSRRVDLIARLLKSSGAMMEWGIEIIVRHPRSASVEDLRAALTGEAGPSFPGAVARALSRVHSPELSSDILSLYLRLDRAGRMELHPIFRRYGRALGEAFKLRRNLGEEDRVVLSARLLKEPCTTCRQIVLLDADSRVSVLKQILDCPAILMRLPWNSWIEGDPGRILPLAAEAAASGTTTLMPLIRQVLGREPRPELIRCAARIKDVQSVPLMAVHLPNAEPLIRAVIVEALGEIGGPEARTILRAELARGSSTQARCAYRALSQCAAEEDEGLFRECLTHDDWAVRLAAVEALSRLAGPDNMSALAVLAGDPVPVVAQRARAALECS